MPDTPRNLSYFRNNVKLASPSKECAKKLSDLDLGGANPNDKLQRLRWYNNEYSRVGACLPVLYPAVGGVVSAFESAVIARGSTLNSAERVAISTFYDSVKSFWSSLREVYPFVGSFLSGALTPLKSTLTTATASASLTSTFYDRNLGVLLGGGNRWIDMGATSAALATATPTHSKTIAFNSANATDASPLYGNASTSSTSSDYLYPRFTDDTIIADAFSYSPSTDRVVIAGNTTRAGTYVANKIASNKVEMYKNGTYRGISATANTETPPAVPFIIGRVLFDATPVLINVDTRLTFFAVGTSLSSGQIITLTNAISALNTALGRT